MDAVFYVNHLIVKPTFKASQRVTQHTGDESLRISTVQPNMFFTSNILNSVNISCKMWRNRKHH